MYFAFCACGCARYIVFIVFGRPLSLCVFYGVDCACGCARYIVFLYVCFMCLPQREHVLFGVVKWKLDVQLYWLDCRRNQEE